MDRVEGQPATSANGASSTLTTRPRRREPLVAAAVDAIVDWVRTRRNASPTEALFENLVPGSA